MKMRVLIFGLIVFATACSEPNAPASEERDAAVAVAVAMGNLVMHAPPAAADLPCPGGGSRRLNGTSQQATMDGIQTANWSLRVTYLNCASEFLNQPVVLNGSVQAEGSSRTVVTTGEMLELNESISGLITSVIDATVRNCNVDLEYSLERANELMIEGTVCGIQIANGRTTLN